MKNVVFAFMIAVLASGLLAGCSDENSNAVPGDVHTLGWADPANSGTAAFHGTPVLAELTAGNEAVLSCRACHGVDLLGSGSVPSCAACHESIFGGHGPGWFNPVGGGDHPAAAIADFTRCTLCHGADYLGGVALSCATAGCHPAALDWPHPASSTWMDPTNVGAHSTSASPCADCHGATLTGGSTGVDCQSCHWLGEADIRVPPGASWTHGGTSATGSSHVDLGSFGAVCNNCHTTWRTFASGSAPGACHDCHTPFGHEVGANWLLPSGHVAEWNSQPASCFNASCHSATTTNGMIPACLDCHTSDPRVTSTGCTSCHAKPPIGTTRPNRNGAHVAHAAVPLFTGQEDCSACHSGAGTGTLNHWYPDPADPADVAVLSGAGVYDDKSTGTPSYNATADTCSNVSCHGGVTTPNWLSGSLDINTDTGTSTGCRGCHISGTSEYNSYFSGRHSLHVNSESIRCHVCHDVSRLNNFSLTLNHFSGLQTTGFELDPANAMNPQLQYDGTCNPSAGGLSGCHGSKTW